MILIKSDIKEHLILLLLLTVMINCSGKNIDDSELIYYEKLNQIEIELYFDTREESDHFHGRLSNLVFPSDGIMMISDQGKMTIEQFNTEGQHIGTVAGEGNGPGELPLPFILYEGGNDTLIVRYFASNQVDYFAPEKDDNLYKYVWSRNPEGFRERHITILGSRSEAEFYASAVWDNPLSRGRLSPVYRQTPIVIIDTFDNILVDSLHMLATASSHAEITEQRAMIVWGMPPYQYQDRFKLMHDGRYMIARPDSSALYIYNKDHELEDRIHLNVKAQPVEKANLDHHFRRLRNLDNNARMEMEARVPAIKPPFLNLWVSEDYIWLHTDNHEEGKQIVVLTMNGKPLGKFDLSRFDVIQNIKKDRIFVLHKNPESGHSIRVYKVDIN